MSDTQNISSVPAGERTQAAEKALEEIRKKPGQPTNITDGSVQLLIAAFNNGLDVRSACVYAGISKSAYYARCQKDPEFLDTMERAKNNLAEMAGTRIFKILKDGEDKVAAPLAWKIFERKMPEMYGQKVTHVDNSKIQNNNFYVLDKNEISNIGKQPDIAKASPSELLEALEETSVVDVGREEVGTPQIHSEEVQYQDSDSSDMSQSPSTV